MDCALESDRTAEYHRFDGIAPGKLVATAGFLTEMIGCGEAGTRHSGKARGNR